MSPRTYFGKIILWQNNFHSAGDKKLFCHPIILPIYSEEQS